MTIIFIDRANNDVYSHPHMIGSLRDIILVDVNSIT
jgi:hypothetical protein